MAGLLFFLELVVSPWAVGADDAAVNMHKSALGFPHVWTDGSLVRDEVSGSAFAGAGICARLHANN